MRTAPTAKVNVTEVWTFLVESAARTGSPTVTFKQEGKKLTGHISSQIVLSQALLSAMKLLSASE